MLLFVVDTMQDNLRWNVTQYGQIPDKRILDPSKSKLLNNSNGASVSITSRSNSIVYPAAKYYSFRDVSLFHEMRGCEFAREAII